MEIRSSSPKAQFAIEFVALLAVMFVIFLSILALTTNRIIALKEAERKQISQDLAELAKSEIDLAQKVSDGYNRSFSLPSRVKGHPYNISVIDNRELAVFYVDQEYVLFLANNVLGTMNPGANTIRKDNGVIFLNS